MERKKFNTETLPDIINKASTINYTQIPNDILRNPEISFKAKGILCLLLSNKEGWRSYLTTIQQMTHEGIVAIRSGIAELEKAGYVLRVQYRDKEGKKVKRGSFWIITDIAGNFFKMDETLLWLENRGWEAFIYRKNIPDCLNMENLYLDSQDKENQRLKILIIKKTNFNNINSSSDLEEKEIPSMDRKKDLITPSQFDSFWEIYPRHVDKGKAKTSWEKLCRSSNGKRPTWKVIKKAILAQKKSARWQDPTFIPHPTTWLNQQRWLDDPAEMKGSHEEKKQTGTNRTRAGGAARTDFSNIKYTTMQNGKMVVMRNGVVVDEEY